jgi:hypothetical protein
MNFSWGFGFAEKKGGRGKKGTKETPAAAEKTDEVETATPVKSPSSAADLEKRNNSCISKSVL